MYIALCTLHYAPGRYFLRDFLGVCTLHYAYCTMHTTLCTLHYAINTLKGGGFSLEIHKFQFLIYNFNKGRVQKNLKTRNDPRAMKQILYDMGPLTLVRWPLYRALKVCHTPQTKIQAEKGPITQKIKKISVSQNDL